MFRDPLRQPDGPPLRVLCVDDNHDVADSEADLLRAVGFESRACYDGRSALTEAAAFAPSVCLLDLNMPGMDGDELAVRLRERAAGTPLVLVAVTAMIGERDVRRLRDADFDLYLVKPVAPEQLTLVVDTLWRAWCRWGCAPPGAGPDRA